MTMFIDGPMKTGKDLIKELRLDKERYQRMIAGMAIEIAIDRSMGGEVHWDPKEVIDEYYKKAKVRVED